MSASETLVSLVVLLLDVESFEDVDELDDDDDDVLLLLLLLLSLGGGGGRLAPLVRLARSCVMLCAALCALVVSPDFTALSRLFKSVKNWLELLSLLDVVPSLVELVLDVPSLDDVPKIEARSFDTLVAADCAVVVSPD